MSKKQEVQRQPPPRDEFHPLGYEEFITHNPKEADELQREANMNQEVQPRVIPKGSHTLKDGREETRFFIRRKAVTIPKMIALFLILSSLFCGNALALRLDSGLDETRDFHDRQVDPNTLTEIYGRTNQGATIQRIANVSSNGGALNLVTGDIYIVTTDNAVTSITTASSWVGRIVTLIRPRGTPNSFTMTDGNNINMNNDKSFAMGSGDTITFIEGKDNDWYQIASSDNYTTAL